MTGISEWWRTMESQNRRWLILNAVLATVVINFVVGGGIGWLSVLGLKHVAVWSIPLAQKTSLFTTALGTFFFLPLTTCLLCTRAVRVAQRRRGLPLVANPFQARLPKHPLRRGLVLGTLSVVVLTPVAALILVAAGVQAMSTSAVVLYAALLAVVLGLVVTPVVAVLAMAEGSSSPATVRA